MKTQSLFRAIVALVVTAFCFIAPKAFSFPFTQTFNGYTNGTLVAGVTNTEGNAFAPCGTNVPASGTNDMYITNTTLTYPGLDCPGTNSVFFGNLGLTERVAINTTNTNGTPYVLANGSIYYSYVFVVTNLGTMTSGGGFVGGFNNVVGPQSAQPTTVGARLYMRLSSVNPTTGYEVGIGKAPSAPSGATWATNEFLVGQTNFFVAKYTFVSAGTSNDFADLWINPTASNFGAGSAPTPDITNNIGPDIQTAGANTIESFMFRQGNAAIPYIVAADLRIGTNWSDVTPPSVTPQPTLSVAASSPNVVLTWPTNFTGFRLQAAPALVTVGTNAWTNVTASTNVVGTNFSVTDGPAAKQNYYRLVNP